MDIFNIVVGVCTIISTVISIIMLKIVYEFKNQTTNKISGKDNKTANVSNTGNVEGDFMQNSVAGDQYNNSTIRK